jgi:hypothetical protein
LCISIPPRVLCRHHLQSMKAVISALCLCVRIHAYTYTVFVLTLASVFSCVPLSGCTRCQLSFFTVQPFIKHTCHLRLKPIILLSKTQGRCVSPRHAGIKVSQRNIHNSGVCTSERNIHNSGVCTSERNIHNSGVCTSERHIHNSRVCTLRCMCITKYIPGSCPGSRQDSRREQGHALLHRIQNTLLLTRLPKLELSRNLLEIGVAAMRSLWHPCSCSNPKLVCVCLCASMYYQRHEYTCPLKHCKCDSRRVYVYYGLVKQAKIARTLLIVYVYEVPKLQVYVYEVTVPLL